MKYALHGITIETPFPCPELSPSSREADVIVKWGIMAPLPFEWHDKGVCYKAAPGKYLLSVIGIADFFVENGNEVTIEADAQGDEDALRLFFYHEVMGALLMQRGCLLLKGFVAERDGKAFAFVGPTPTGKTMLAARLARQGFNIVSDGFSCFNGNGKPQAQPGYPQLMLWKKSLKELGISRQKLKPVRSGMQRYYLPLQQSFRDEPVCLEAIYILASHNRAELLLQEIKGAEKLFALLSYRYHPELVPPLGIAGTQNRLAANLANSASVKIVCHNHALVPSDEFIGHMEKELEAAAR